MENESPMVISSILRSVNKSFETFKHSLEHNPDYEYLSKKVQEIQKNLTLIRTQLTQLETTDISRNAYTSFLTQENNLLSAINCTNEQ